MTISYQSADLVDVGGQHVLIRADLNVPIAAGTIGDRTRIDRFVPTLCNLLDRGAAVTIMTHLGRPGGHLEPTLSTHPLVSILAAKTGYPVDFADSCIGAARDARGAALLPGQALLLENLRFHRGEEKNDAAFANSLANYGDLYINDAFACAHRAHASIHAITRYLPAYAGPTLLQELDALAHIYDNSRRPIMALIGGAKISTKIAILDHLIDTVDTIIVGGGMANSFLYAQGHEVGRSLCEPDLAATARNLLDKAAAKGCHFVVPHDVVIAQSLTVAAPHQNISPEAIPADSMIVDLGAKTIATLGHLLATHKTLLWNGPLGAFETPPFDHSTIVTARRAAAFTQAGNLISIAGGGDTLAALNGAHVVNDFSYTSTAGGAFLEWLEGKELPGLTVLRAPTTRPDEDPR